MDRAFDGVGRRCWLEERWVGDEADDEEPLVLRLALGRPGRPVILGGPGSPRDVFRVWHLLLPCDDGNLESELMGWCQVELVLVKWKWSVVSQDGPWAFLQFPRTTAMDGFIESWLRPLASIPKHHNFSNINTR